MRNFMDPGPALGVSIWSGFDADLEPIYDLVEAARDALGRPEH